MDAVIAKWADAAGHPAGAALRAAGFAGVVIYVGTPSSAKDCSAAVYADYAAHGLGVIAVYENLTTDITGGRAAGVAHAQAALADMAAKNIPASVPLGATADEHFTSTMVSLAVQYQGGFHDTVRAAHPGRPVVAYGFAEFLTAVRATGLADVFWQCGTAPASGAGVHFWQRNTSPSTAIVGGVVCDIDDQLLPVPEGIDVAQLDDIQAAIQTVAAGVGDLREQVCGKGCRTTGYTGWVQLGGHTLVDSVEIVLANLAANRTAIMAAVNSDAAAGKSALAALLTAVQASDPAATARALVAAGLNAQAVAQALVADLAPKT
jgi:hypothetical protein